MKVGRLAQRGNAWAVVIPASIRRELKWWPGDEIQIVPRNGTIHLRNLTQHDVTMTKKVKSNVFSDDNTA